MDLSINYEIFFKNLKFWGFHTLINAIPSILFAYMDGRDTLVEFTAIFIGIILFTVMLTFFISMKDVHAYRNREFVDRSIRLGTRFRIGVILIGSCGILGSYFFYIVGFEPLTKLFSILFIVWTPDLISGFVSDGAYDLVRFSFGSSRNFIPTIMIILIQGLLLFCMLITSGMLLASVGFGVKNGRTKQPIAE